MKRFLCLFLILCLFLSGCSSRLKEPVTFYYIRSEYQEDMDSIIKSEEREASGHRNDFSYLLALYMMGPADEDLRSPLPYGTIILKSDLKSTGIQLELSDTSKTMTDAEFSLACACLALTCLDYTQANTITINSGDRSVTMSRDTLILHDTYNAVTTEEAK